MSDAEYPFQSLGHVIDEGQENATVERRASMTRAQRSTRR
jgi:hypothetical protein